MMRALFDVLLFLSMLIVGALTSNETLTCYESDGPASETNLVLKDVSRNLSDFPACIIVFKDPCSPSAQIQRSIYEFANNDTLGKCIYSSHVGWKCFCDRDRCNENAFDFEKPLLSSKKNVTRISRKERNKLDCIFKDDTTNIHSVPVTRGNKPRNNATIPCRNCVKRNSASNQTSPSKPKDINQENTSKEKKGFTSVPWMITWVMLILDLLLGAVFLASRWIRRRNKEKQAADPQEEGETAIEKTQEKSIATQVDTAVSSGKQQDWTTRESTKLESTNLNTTKIDNTKVETTQLTTKPPVSVTLA